MKYKRKALIITLLLVMSLVYYDNVLLNGIIKKESPTYLRIGYINLHKSKVSLNELKKIESYNCDFWFFLEWNGNNFDSYKNFLKKYIVYQIRDKNTFGYCILTKKRVIIAQLKAKTYLCDYPKYQIKYNYKNAIDIFFVHVPPPVPTCGMETGEYISDLVSAVQKNENRNANIIVGDFNSLPFQKAINNIKMAGYKDSHASLNKLPVGTFGVFPGFPKIFKIDYIFYKGSIEPKYIARFSVNTSDHSGWIADFELARGSKLSLSNNIPL